ncbi:hypothetical protein Amn_18790 [Aminobacter sp. Y103A]|uniref:hypothetical protein n=1 Tax=Aminobacter sp. Y103A TaxID=1870862 RepID=UPI0025723588|nr:hypothetical protein [Aminobacter sp. SS-2016]BBD36999.1 hypothetical protein Amn_18790 [Aminobacter sp. SS-2016]
MSNVIALQTQIKALHPSTGKQVTVVGIATSPSSLDPKLVVLHRGPHGIVAELVDYADEAPPTVAA